VIFRHPRAVEQLLRSGVVATMRSYRYRPGQVVRVRTPQGVFRGVVMAVYPNTPENRLELYALSGFNSPGEWLAEAIGLHGGIPRYIVVVGRA